MTPSTITAAELAITNHTTGETRKRKIELRRYYGVTLIGELTSNGSIPMVSRCLSNLLKITEVKMTMEVSSSYLKDVNWKDPVSITTALVNLWNEEFSPNPPLDLDQAIKNTLS